MALDRVVIIGVGLIGGSAGLAVRQRHPDCEVVGVGQNADGVAGMVAWGAVHKGTTDLAAAADADLVVLATPVGVAVSVLDRLPKLRGVATDVLSTKRSVVAAAEARHIRFVGSHPMAGSDRRGVANARADLLAGAACLITPTGRTDAGDLQFVEQFWASIGMTTRRMTPAVHDRLVARASHVPHAVAAAIVAIQSDDSLSVAAGGFRDTTRVAGGDPDLWRDILLDNRDQVADALRLLRGELDAVIERLVAGDAEGLRAWLAASAGRRGAVYNDRD
jgi:prephenate dehydrogenase